MLKELHDKINGICILILLAMFVDFIVSALIVVYLAKHMSG